MTVVAVAVVTLVAVVIVMAVMAVKVTIAMMVVMCQPPQHQTPPATHLEDRRRPR